MVIIPGTGYSLGLSGIDGKPDVVPQEAILLDQVHGDLIVINPAGGESADGMVLRRGSGTPALKVADCLPVFALWDDHIGAVHAGWRSLAAGIVENVIAAVDQPLRWLVMGPCICKNCYEVGSEVREAVLAGNSAVEAEQLSVGLDLRGSALRRFERACRSEFQLLNIDDCTLESAGLYSYRENGTAGRNILWLAENESGEHIRQLYGEVECNSPERR